MRDSKTLIIKISGIHRRKWRLNLTTEKINLDYKYKTGYTVSTMKKYVEVTEAPSAVVVLVHILLGAIILVFGFGSIPLMINQTLLPGVFGIIGAVAAFLATLGLFYYNIKQLLNKWTITTYED